MISRIEAERAIKEWNDHIADFMANKLPELLKAEGVQVKNGRICMNDWFKANEIVERQNFYKTGHELQMKLRDAGHDVKMNMQDNTLVLW